MRNHQILLAFRSNLDWHELGLHVAENTVFQKKISDILNEHSFRLSSIVFDIVHYVKEIHFSIKRSPKNPRSVISVIFNVALMPDLTVLNV